MTEEPFDEWDRFRKAYEKALKDRGSPGLQTEFRRLTESLGKPESTTETTNALSKTTDGIGIPSNPQNQTLQIPFSRLGKDRTDVVSYRIPQIRSGHTWYCIVCGAENPSGDQRDERTYSCQKCGRDVRYTLSERADIIFGDKQ